ncbi:MAG: ATP-binding protein [Rickettsiaceae bacterium]|nr:ATP-binding protein [Rickettsiaceae bacterium]
MNEILKKIAKLILGRKNSDIFLTILVAVAILFFSLTLYSFYVKVDFARIVSLLLFDLIITLVLIIFSTRKTLLLIFKDYNNSRIRMRIIMMFSIIAAIPTILVSTFSVAIFNLGLQGWFDKEVSSAVNQSVHIAGIYVSQNKLQLRDSAVAIASDLNSLRFELERNGLLPRVLSAHTEMRNLTEAMIFDRSSKTILAQTQMSFALTLWALPQDIFDKANAGDVPEIQNDPGKLKMLVRLSEFPGETYLMVGKIIDEETVQYLDKTLGAAAKYQNLMHKKLSFQVSFGIVFLLVSGVIVAATIVVGSIFAGRITRPIKMLVQATEKVQSGDLTTQIDLPYSQEDELVILTHAFNRMIKKIDIQQKDIALAHRAMAWSDVARRVAHEIKNPLTPISLSADRLVKKFSAQVGEDPEFAKYIGIIKRHTNDIQKIITEFADFAKMPAPNFEKVNIVGLIRELVDSRQIINEAIKYQFHSNVKNVEFVCDVTQMHQVIINLLKNAEEAMENLNSRAKEISVSVMLDQEEMLITVEDNGKGFPLHLIDKVTDPYLTTRSKGMGLGLSIVKKITYDHGGDIVISNLQEGGGCVRLIFSSSTIGTKIKK